MTSSQEIVNKQILVNQNLIQTKFQQHKGMSSDFTPKQSFHSFVGVALDIGGRDHMEDEFNVVLNKDLSYFGVYDGHAGSLTSSFVRDNLAKQFFSKGVNSMRNKTSLQAAMTKAHVDVDKEYFVMEQQARKDGTHSSYSGSTSISFVFKQSNFFYFFWYFCIFFFTNVTIKEKDGVSLLMQEIVVLFYFTKEKLLIYLLTTVFYVLVFLVPKRNVL